MNLKAPEGKIVISVDMNSKKTHRFESGVEIHLARGYNNFNLRTYYPVNGKVIAAKNIPVDTIVLIQYNAVSETNRVYNFKPLSGKEAAGDIQYYSIPEEMAFAYLDGSEWKPMKNFVFALRVFKPYEGILSGIEPTKLKDTLYIQTGHLKGRVVKTLKAADYEICFQDITGREGNIIVAEHYEDQDHDRDLIICILDELTEQLHEGRLLVGLTKSDAKPIKEYGNFRFQYNLANR